MSYFSIIVPVFNRPNEVDELLFSLTNQSFSDFEVVVVEDGSEVKCEHIVEKYLKSFCIQYFYCKN